MGALDTLYPAMPQETLRVNDMTRSLANIPKFNIGQSMCDSLDHVPSMPNSLNSAQLFTFEDNLCRAPTLRHETQTHRVHLDWLIERVNSEHSVFIQNVRTRDAFADTLTKVSFTCYTFCKLSNPEMSV